MKIEIPEDLADWAKTRGMETERECRKAYDAVNDFIDVTKRRNEAMRRRAKAEPNVASDEGAALIFATADAQIAALNRVIVEADSALAEKHQSLRVEIVDCNEGIWKATADFFGEKLVDAINAAIEPFFPDAAQRAGLIRRTMVGNSPYWGLARTIGRRSIPAMAEGMIPMIQVGFEVSNDLIKLSEGEISVELPFLEPPAKAARSAKKSV